MLEEIKEYMDTDGNLAMMSLGEAAKAERYMKWLIEHTERRSAQVELPCGCTCSCHDKSMFHISNVGHKEDSCACSGKANCSCG